MSLWEQFGEKLAALRQWAQGVDLPFLSAADYEAFPVSEAEIRQAEREFGVTLPPDFRAFLRHVGTGRAWPGNLILAMPWGLTSRSREPFPLSSPMLGLCSPEVAQLPEDKRWEEFGRLSDLWNAVPQGHGVLEFCGYGCGINAVLIVNGPLTGRIWVTQADTAYYGPFGGLETLHDGGADWVPTDTAREYSFVDWYVHWLDCELSRAAALGSNNFFAPPAPGR